jgi:uncharacterized protein (DUF58 family)
MDPKEIIKNIRKIEIRTKNLSNSIFSGDYHSAFRGTGMAFSEVRSYRFGDEIKSIDWNVTARTNEPYVKIFDEERELNVILLIDISKSTAIGTKLKLKNEIAAEIAALLSFSAISNNDKVGAILFTDKIEKFIPPKKGKKHVLRIIREIIYHVPGGKKTDVSIALDYLNNVILKKSIVFLISDFISPDFKNSLQISRKKHDLIALRIYDDIENYLPELNIISVKDPESENIFEIDTSSLEIRKAYSQSIKEQIDSLKYLFLSNKIDFLELNSTVDYSALLHTFFRKRTK